MNVIFAILGGGMSLGQTLPSLDAFAAGQAAAYKMFETIKTKPKIDVYSMTGKVLDEIKGDVELKDVYFRYPARFWWIFVGCTKWHHRGFGGAEWKRKINSDQSD